MVGMEQDSLRGSEKSFSVEGFDVSDCNVIGRISCYCDDLDNICNFSHSVAGHSGRKGWRLLWYVFQLVSVGTSIGAVQPSLKKTIRGEFFSLKRKNIKTSGGGMGGENSLLTQSSCAGAGTEPGKIYALADFFYFSTSLMDWLIVKKWTIFGGFLFKIPSSYHAVYTVHTMNVIQTFAALSSPEALSLRPTSRLSLETIFCKFPFFMIHWLHCVYCL